MFRSSKEAQNEADKVAVDHLSSQTGPSSSSGETDLYKILYKIHLQVLVEKEGFGSPVYRSRMYGKPHNPIFVSSVDIEGEIFVGEEAKRKKEAELSAVKAAYRALSSKLATKKRKNRP